MKKERNELLRLQTMIENDRISAGDNFLQLVENDLIKLLKLHQHIFVFYFLFVLNNLKILLKS